MLCSCPLLPSPVGAFSEPHAVKAGRCSTLHVSPFPRYYVRSMMQARRAADERLSQLRTLCDTERQRVQGFTSAMDSWVQGLGAGAETTRKHISDVSTDWPTGALC